MKKLAIATGVALALSLVVAVPSSAAAEPVGSCATSSVSADCRTGTASGSRSSVARHVVGATTLIVGSGDYGDLNPNDTLFQHLSAGGWAVDEYSVLPANITQYKTIWYVDTNPIGSQDGQRLVAFVRRGGGLYLTGERPCCEDLNNQDTAIVNALVPGVTVGGLGDVDGNNTTEPINAAAPGTLATTPYFVTDWNVAASGGMSGVAPANITTTSPSGTPTGGAWDAPAMTGGARGRLVVQMDINWLETITDQSLNGLFARNIQYFLQRGRARTPSSAQYVALGDSYASGEGSFDYLANSATKYNKCHRATHGYAEQLSAYLNQSLAFAACSGDVIAHLAQSSVDVAALYSPERTANRGGQAQMANLSASTRVVTLSIGGNDIGFADVLKDCVSGAQADGSYGCQGRDQAAVTSNIAALTTGTFGQGCKAFLPSANPAIAEDEYCGARPRLSSVYAQIAVLAPNASIYVVGYPRVFGTTFAPDKTCDVGGIGSIRYSIKASDVRWLNTQANVLDQTIRSEVGVANTKLGANRVTFVDPRPTFAGHGVCDSGAPWLNALSIGRTLPPRPNQESFHPNTVGQDALYALLVQSLR